LALCHLVDPSAAIAELARVLHDGGSLVITDPHTYGALLGGQAFYGGISADKPMTWVRNHYHEASTWLRAFAGAGLQVESCEEPRFTDAQIAAMPSSFVFPDVGVAAATGLPTLWIWHLTKKSTS
jgi:ubiquinone/menaquinone biosynthesis C-methylase UbiE